jgi:hypothetical protein
LAWGCKLTWSLSPNAFELQHQEESVDISAKIGARVRKKIKPKLEPGESVQQVFLAQSGLHPKWLIPLALVMLFTNKY